MKIFQPNDLQAIATLFKQKKIGIIPTDTIYGLAGVTGDPHIKWQITTIKKRPRNKEIAIIVNSIEQMGKIIKLTPSILNIINSSSNSITILGQKTAAPILNNLYRENDKVGVRITNLLWLQNLINYTGPLFCTSVNFAGEEPLKDFEQLKRFPADFMVATDSTIGDNDTQKPSRIYDAIDDVWLR